MVSVEVFAPFPLTLPIRDRSTLRSWWLVFVGIFFHSALHGHGGMCVRFLLGDLLFLDSALGVERGGEDAKDMGFTA